MFATLLGGLPSPVAPDGHAGTIDQAIERAIRAQEAAGLELITDGRLRDPGFARLGGLVVSGRPADTTGAVEEVVEAWTFAAGVTDRAVKQALPGPYSIGRRLLSGDGNRESATLTAAGALAAVVAALRDAGCALVDIEETEAHGIGDDEQERGLFRAAHRRLTEGHGDGIHLCLSLVGESAATAGPETILDARYASYAFDLIAGPDNWNLAARVPGDRGVIAGVLSARETSDEPKEIMLWAAHRVASSSGRGMDRVGLGSAGSFANLAWEVAVKKMQRLGEAARLASMPPSEELASSLDPRAVSSRRAALGHGVPRPPRRRR